MAERAYYIRIDGQNIDVTEEVYKTYYNGRRKERYMTQDLKQEHFGPMSIHWTQKVELFMLPE